MTTEFAWKSRLTAAMLGCRSRKDLCNAFRAVNPATPFELQRAHKWLQGRAMPRGGAIYADWVLVIGTARSPGWIASCSREAFLAEIARLAEADAQALEAQAMAFGGVAPTPTPTGHYLCGAFVAYSHAWSPAHKGQLVRGGLRLTPGRGTNFGVEYREEIAGGPLLMAGKAELSGRLVHMTLRDPAGGTPLFVALTVPGRPANMVCGIMAGATTASSDPEPSATRIVALRLGPEAEGLLDAGHRYLGVGQLPADLATLGVTKGAGALLNFLGGGFTQIDHADAATLAAAFD